MTQRTARPGITPLDRADRLRESLSVFGGIAAPVLLGLEHAQGFEGQIAALMAQSTLGSQLGCIST